MSFDQDPNEQANISGADLAILVDELKELRRKLAEQQATLRYYAGITDVEVVASEELTAQLSAAKQEDYEQGHAAAMIGDGVSSAELAAYERGKQAGRDEVLRELSGQEPVAYVLSDEEAARTDGRTPVVYIGALPKGKQLIVRPSAPIATTKGEKHE